MDLTGIGTALVGISGKVIDKLFPDPAEAARAKAELMQMQQDGELKELETRMSAIIAEANSSDPWTSRARPSFLYVVYIIILAAIPMGFLHAVRPEVAISVAAGFKSWLDAIPPDMWMLFGAGYLGYTGARTFDKRKDSSK
jgi:hypothetical protein